MVIPNVEKEALKKLLPFLAHMWIWILIPFCT